ncbi:pre-mRNA cleavage complex 2 protein Pcf11 [Pristis pectinata]|uniref:pre-mRNA cleavage complex 2 protein Pcf11 n=1 Tax=Pristis pectinata TaxID=685728 RepID=UPI00223D895A|nr:pre-mRNA cleavage complex 2 protein Pcf11 [Pristis pectinata]
MAEDTAKADACKEYQSSLEDLTFNSKPHINNLTILAEENLKYSPEIVKLIEAQISKAPVSEKLPVMYLMDSIVKNVGGSYITLFAQNLGLTFASVFEKVDESTRKSLFKLRSTWDDMFQLTKLYALDVKVNKLDPAWPIKPLPPNVNSSSIHVNPKFLNRSLEEPSTSSSTVAPVNSAKQNIAESQKNVTQEQEQFIRQQLLAKQKQLLELQQKKLELELEQTKAQLIASLASQHPIPDSMVTLGHSKQHVPITKVSPMLSTGSAKPTPAAVRPLQQESAQPEKSQAAHASDTKASNRDPRINRPSQQTKDSAKKEGPVQTVKSDKTVSKKNSPARGSSEKSANQISISKPDKDKVCDRSARKESKVSEGKSKVVSPVKNKLPVKNTRKVDTEKVKVEVAKRDPRLRKSSQDKTDSKVESKERRTSTEKKVEEDQSKGTERKSSITRSRAINGILGNEKDGKEIERDVKSGGFNFRGHPRSSRSRSPRSRSPKSRSPISRSTRQRGRLSPKRRRISVSPLSKVQDKEKPVKRPLSDEYKQNSNWEHRDLRKKANSKPEARDSRKPKRTRDERSQESQVARPENRNSPRRSPEPKENAENWHDPPSAKRWKSGWEEAKSLKQKQDTQVHTKYPHQKEVYPGSKGILSPRAPRQQRMSVDANLQIPKELTNANKRDLLKKANQRLAAAEISYDEFLVVAHQINQLFQYQEEKNRSGDWQASHVSPRGFKAELKGESPARTQGKGGSLSEAELSYLEHMSKLKRTRVQSEQSHDTELRWKTRESHKKDVSGDLSLGVREDGDQGSKSPNVNSSRHDTRGTFQERKLGEKREANESGHHSEGRHSERRKPCDKTVRHSPVGDNRQSHDKHYDRVSPPHQRTNPLDERNQSNVRDSKKHTDEALPTKPRISPNPEDRYKTDSNHGMRQLELARSEHHKDQRQGTHQPERDLKEFGPRERTDSKREEPRQRDRRSEERSAYDAPPRGAGLVENPRLRSGVHEIPQRFRELSDRSGPGKSGSIRNVDKIRTDESIESDRTWVHGRDGSPSRDIRITGSRIRLQDLPEQLVQPINDSPEQSGLWIEGIPGQPSKHFDGLGQSGACFDGPHRGHPAACFDCPGNLRLGQPCVRFDGPGGPRSGLRFESSRPRQLGPHFDGPRMGQPGPRFDGPRMGQLGPRFDGPHLGQPGVRFNGPHLAQPGARFDNAGGQPGVHFEGPQPGARIDGSHPGHFDSPGGHPGQPSSRFGLPAGQPGAQLDNPGGHLGHPRFDPHPGQPAMHFDVPHPRQSCTRFDNPDGLVGQPHLRFDGPQSGPPNMRFDGPGSRLGQPITRFDGPRPGQLGAHFDGPSGRAAQCGVRFDGPQMGQPGAHFDGSGNHPGQPAIRFDGPAGTRFDIIAAQPGTYFESSRGPQFDGAAVHPDPRCSVAGHLFNNHPPSSQYQGRGFDGQSGPRFNMPQGSHFNESAVHGATTLANPTYVPTAGPCFDGQTPLPRLAGPHNDQYEPTCGTFYNNNISSSLPENLPRQLQPVNAMTGFSHNQIPFSQGQQYLPSQSTVPVTQIQQGSSFAPLDNHLGQLDVNELFSKLISTGILKSNPVESTPTQGDPQASTTVEDDEEEENEESIPDLTNFQIEELKQRYEGVISRLYTGIQCYSCGMRFTASQTDVYADHLDWHYRMNRMEKDITKKVTYRKWYYSLTDWIEFEEIADLEERAKSQFFEKVHEEVVQRTQEAAKEKEFQSVPAGPAGVHEVCEICQEAFEQYWDEDEEEWHLKNAVRVDSTTYHPACYEDYKNASFTDSTPSPSEAPIENPLHSVIKQEQSDVSSKTSDLASSCKNTEAEGSSVTDIKTEKDTATVKMETV